MKAKARLLSAVISGAVMATACVGGMEVFGKGDMYGTIIAEAEAVYDGTAEIMAEKSVKSEKGEDVSVPVYLIPEEKAVPNGIYKLCFKVSYNTSALSLAAIERGTGLSGGMFGCKGDTVMFMAVRGNMKVDTQKPVCTLKFHIKDTTSGVYPIKLINQSGSTTEPVQILSTHSKNGNTYLRPVMNSGSVIVGNGDSLSRVTNVAADINGNVSWDPAYNASYYRVTRVVDGTSYTSGKITDTMYKLAVVPETDFYVYVTAYDKSGASTVSESVLVKNNNSGFGKPQNISVDSNGLVTWDAVSNAVYYTVTRISDGKEVTTPKIKATTYQFQTVPETAYQVYITAYDKNDSFRVSDIYNVKSSQLEKASDLQVDAGGNVTWQELGCAVSYKVTRVSDGKSTTTPMIYNTNYKFVSVPLTEYQVYVTSYDGKGNSVRSDTVTVTPGGDITEAPGKATDINVDEEGNVTWTAGEEAVYYTVSRVSNGKTVTTPKISRTNYKFVSVPKTSYEVYITSYDSEGNYAVSDIYKVTVPEDPAKLGEVTGVSVDENGLITWNSTNNAVSYRVTVVSEDEEFISEPLTVNSYAPEVIPVSDYEVYVTAYDAAGNSAKSKNVTVKGKGEDPSLKLGEITEISVDEDGVITWNKVENAVSYTVTIINNGTEVTSDKLTGTKYVPETVPETDYEVYVTAYDAKNNYVNSDTVEIAFE